MKKSSVIIVVIVVLLALCLPIISLAHPGRTDSNGGHTDHSTGEYHYHHGYSAHQHEDGECPYEQRDFAGVIKPDAPENTEEADEELGLYSNYIELENLEDVLRSEFEGELADEIRDVIVYNPDTKILDISITYVEYESLWDVSMRQYGEEITERIFCNPDLVILSPEDIADRHGVEEYEDDTDEDDDIEEEYDDNDRDRDDEEEDEDEGKKSFFEHKANRISTVIISVILFSFISLCVVEHFKDKKK